MKALITVGCKTDHGGIISIGDSSFLVEGKAVHLDGMTHFCPKCKVQSRAIASNQGFMIVGGKSIVAVGDTSSCGSRYLKLSDIAVFSSGSGNSSSPSSNNQKKLQKNSFLSNFSSNQPPNAINSFASYSTVDEDGNYIKVEEKPVKQFTFIEETFIAPLRVLVGGIGKIGKLGAHGKEPIYPNDKAAKKAAEAMGYKKTNYRTKSDAAVFKKGNSYISRDIDGHNGGAWKEASSVDKLNSKTTRNGTYDINMKRIGD